MRRGRTRRGIASRMLLTTFIILVGAIAGLYVALPYVVQEFLPPWFARHGIRFSVDAVDHDILSTQLVLKGVHISRDRPLLTAREASVQADLKALLGGALRLKLLTLTGGELMVQKDPHGGWQVGGLALSASDTPLRTGIGRLEVRDFTVRYVGTWSEDLYLEKALLKDVHLDASGVPISFELDGVMGQGHVAATGRAWPTRDEPMVDAKLSLAQFPVESLGGAFAALGLPLRQGVLGADVRLRLVSAAGAGGRVADVEGEVQLSGVKGQTRQVLLRDGDLLWQGQGRIVLPVSGGPLAEQRLRGRVTAGHLAGELTLDARPGAGRPFQLQDASWEGRIAWGTAAEAVERLAVNGDAHVGRLAFADRTGRIIALEQVALWGVEQRSGEKLGVGRVQAQAAYGAGMAGGGGAASRVASLHPDTAEWHAGRLEAERLGLDDEGRIELASVDLEDVQLNPVGGARPGFVQHARLDRLEVNDGSLRASSVAFEGLKLEGRGPGREDAIEVDLGVLQDLSAPDPNRIQIGEARLSRVRTGLVRDPDGTWRGLLLPSPEEGAHLSLGLLRLAGTNRIEIVDFSLDPPYRVTLSPLDGWLANWDSLQPTDGGRFVVNTSVGEGGAIEASGHLGPTSGPLELALHAELSAVRLADLPKAVTAAIAGHTNTGRVAGQVDLDVGRDRWRALARLQLSALAATGSAARPALGFLTDERQGLRLDLRLAGRAHGQGLERLLAESFRRSAVTSIVDYYGSLGVTEAGAEAGLRKARLTLKPIGFVPGSASFDRDAASRLETLVDRMKHRPLTRVKVCALAVTKDFIRPSTEGGPTPVDLASKGKALAGLRDSFVRDHLTDRLGLSRIRLLPCEPAFHPSPEAEPRVELTLELVR